MSASTPENVLNLGSFLEERGLRCDRDEELRSFGDRLILYWDDSIGVRVVRDRGIWSVDVSDSREGKDWYDVPLLMELLQGRGEDVRPIEEQIEFIMNSWHEMKQCFSCERRSLTRASLHELGLSRTRRRIPGLFQ